MVIESKKKILWNPESSIFNQLINIGLTKSYLAQGFVFEIRVRYGDISLSCLAFTFSPAGESLLDRLVTVSHVCHCGNETERCYELSQLLMIHHKCENLNLHNLELRLNALRRGAPSINSLVELID